ncbi:MAG: polyprenyl synthetase family protein [Candidatus Bipolaricaulota bacterium]|nr:polyprenyl synthetase family protein [Candidatus Bipolaricaulota bacterium]MCS7275149.1 polyprenyl synthetase family protein [Candidatus Bipolaricaulota bacterium]MDW8111602.1 polyprenyl synthetase family protein [Candidatus Bipolaricaulota bacterium]MDW8329693.1 polyprenyl synthetase family protein [Candidatus Bipolaricaulota bacterium]
MRSEIVGLLTRDDVEIYHVVREFQSAFNRVLERALEEHARRRAQLPPLARRALAGSDPFSLQEFTLRGGKRLRPLIFCCGYLCLDGPETDEILKASVAIELLQTGLLIHDDIIDRSRERRQGQTMHLLWEEYFRQERYRSRFAGAREHFGIAMALLMGDISSALAYEMLLSADFPLEQKLRAVETFSDVIVRVAVGELLDVDLSLRSLENLQEEEILKVYELKTAGYTTEGPLQIGAALGGANEAQLRLLSRYAIPLGIAFQIQDDILGMFGGREEIGKDEGSDLIEAKRTPLLLWAWRQSHLGERARLDSLLQNAEEAYRELDFVRELFVRTGALRRAQELIAEHFSRVRASLAEIESEFGTRAARLLQKIASYIETREDYKGALERYVARVNG